jgi:hypothetical protein
LHTWKADEILEFADHMHGRRMVATFGKCHAINVDPKEETETPESVKFLGDVVSLVDRATNGCKLARKAYEILRKLGPIWQMSLGIPPNECVASTAEPTQAEWACVKLACVHEDFGQEENSEHPRDSIQLRLPTSENPQPPPSRSPPMQPRDSSV